jgi:uncharacterized protein YbaA (DUF1428 family)
MSYVDGFVIPLPKKNLATYKRIAKVACKVWMDHGAIDYCECTGDDLSSPCGMSFPDGIRSKKGETVVFAWIKYESKAHRNKVNAAVMKDPRIAALGTKMPFDMKRMICGGFKVLVEA